MLLTAEQGQHRLTAPSVPAEPYAPQPPNKQGRTSVFL